jgi:integrating conjugative element protein (TIGR03757 family)
VNSMMFAFLLLAATASPAEEPMTLEFFVGQGTSVTDLEAAGRHEVAIYRVDALHALIGRIKEQLPTDPAEEPHQARAALLALTPAERDSLREATEGLLRARYRYGLDRYPAVVLDGRAVVYGVTDLDRAVAIYRAWQRRERR